MESHATRLITSGLVNNGIFASSSSSSSAPAPAPPPLPSSSSSICMPLLSSSSKRFNWMALLGIAVSGVGSSNELNNGSIWPDISPSGEWKWREKNVNFSNSLEWRDSHWTAMSIVYFPVYIGEQIANSGLADHAPSTARTIYKYVII